MFGVTPVAGLRLIDAPEVAIVCVLMAAIYSVDQDIMLDTPGVGKVACPEKGSLSHANDRLAGAIRAHDEQAVGLTWQVRISKIYGSI